MQQADATRAPISLRGAVARLTGANAFTLFLGLVTGPILARSLGAEGRGELAAIVVVFSIMPWVLDLGLATYVARSRGAATPVARGALLGTLVPITLVLSLLGPALAGPIAEVVGRDREVVERYVWLGLMLAPVIVVLQTIGGVPWGEQRWTTFTAMRVLSPLFSTGVIVVVWAMGDLTVAKAALAYFAAAVVAGLPLIPIVARTRDWRFDRKIGREGLAFGARSWLASLAHLANGRLDQLLMAALVPSRQLGLYAIALTVSNLMSSFVGAMATALLPRAAADESDIVRRACRCTVALVLGGGVVLAALAPVLVPFVFGRDFDDAVVPTLLLLVASVGASLTFVLGSAVAGANAPQVNLHAQLLALVVAVPLLVVLVPETGATGAAAISIVSSGLSSAYLVHRSRRLFGGRLQEYLVPHRSDLAMLRTERRWGTRRTRG